MWVKRAEWEQLLRSAGRVETSEFLLTQAKERILRYQEQVGIYKRRVAELEAGILDLQDKLNRQNKIVTDAPRMVPLDLALFDEDPELVEKDREQALREGTTDGLLAEMEG